MQDFEDDQIDIERFLNLRYSGTDVAMMTKATEGSSYAQVDHSALNFIKIGEWHVCRECHLEAEVPSVYFNPFSFILMNPNTT